MRLRPTTARQHVIRIGMIGLDTSHVTAFTRILNDPQADGDLAAVSVVAGFPGGSELPLSRDRVAGFAEELRNAGVEIVESIPALLQRVDAVMLESVDGRTHLADATQVIDAGKPLFVDKPVAGSLADVRTIYARAADRGVPIWSSSCVRYAPSLQQVLKNMDVGVIRGCTLWGPFSKQAGIPDLFFYGIHGVEGLFTLLGPGCDTVTRTSGNNAEVVTGVWRDGRVGTYHGLSCGQPEFGACVFGEHQTVVIGDFVAYRELCERIATFFVTGQPPVPADETIEIYAFMEAADESLRRGGGPVKLVEVNS